MTNKVMDLILAISLGILIGTCIRDCSVHSAHAGLSNGITDHTARMADALERIANVLEKKK